MVDRLNDKVALVSGAGSSGPGWGNGKATAVLFAREGAKVLATDINLDAAPDHRTRRALLHLSYSCAPQVTLAALVTHDPLQTFGAVDSNTGSCPKGDPRPGPR
jgi:NAD(P)-dependent dehydrogenase (short-subunit alcohol dehydrogenase family)